MRGQGSFSGSVVCAAGFGQLYVLWIFATLGERDFAGVFPRSSAIRVTHEQLLQFGRY